MRPEPSVQRERFRFAGAEMDTEQRELRLGSGRVQLAPKPFELLRLLLAHRDRALSRGEILERVWHGVHVSEATLSSTLRDLRRALGDEGRHSRLIRTIRGVGVRFIAPVEEVEVPPDREAATELFLGRESSLERMQAALSEAWCGRGGVLMIAGEPGIGKTRLVEELAREVRDAGGAAYLGSTSGSNLPYGPWVAPVRELAASRSCEALFADSGAAPLDLAPLVRDLSVREEPHFDAREAGGSDSSLLLFDAVANLLRRAARRAPIAILLDDLHGAARPALHLLEFLAGELAEARVVLVGSYRSSELAEEHPLVATLAELARHPRFEWQCLGGLLPSETRALIASVAGCEPPPAVVDSIRARTDGNPLFASELAREWTVRGREDGEPPVPPRVRELVHGLVLRLSARSRAVLEAAATIGEFGVEALRRESGLGEDAVLDALEEARRAGLLEARAAGVQRFVHALVREAICAGLARDVRADTPELARELASGS